MIAFLMYERRLDIAVAFIAVVVCPLRLECAECKVGLTQTSRVIH